MSQLFFLEECNSTNDEVLKFITPKTSDFVSVYTFNQTKGRGQYGNQWQCSKNQNIAFSLAIKSEHFAWNNSILNYHTALVYQRFLANLTHFEVKIKWPNDFIIAKKKIAGMLIEKKKHLRENYLVIGIGTNVLQLDFKELPKASSLFVQTSLTFDLHDVAKQTHCFLMENLPSKKTEEEILQKYNDTLFLKGEVAVISKNKVRQNGIIKNADKDGYLWIDLENEGLQKYYHKEVELLY